MPELTPCIDCAHQISRSASSCPKCNSSHPHGVYCLFCKDVGGSPLSDKKAHKHPHHKSDWGFTYYHPGCVEKLLAIPNGLSCLECSVSLSSDWTWQDLCDNGHVSCKNCGVRNVFYQKGNCSRCALPLLGFHRMVDTGSVYSSTKYHEYCFQVVQRLSAIAAQKAGPDPEKRKNKIVSRATWIGALIGLVLGVGISTFIAVFGLSDHPVPGVAIIAAGIVGTFLGGLLGLFIGAFIVSW